SLLTLVVVLGCESEGTGVEEPGQLTFEEIVGTYAAVVMTTTSGGTTVDQLALGATLDLVLHDDGTTTGRLFVPDGAEEGGDADMDLGGTFSFDASDGAVTFDHGADTFVRNMTFTASRLDGA